MFSTVVRALWGDISKDEIRKIGFLSFIMMLIIGTYWMIRPSKDPLFNILVGYRQWQPVAKIFSLFVMIFVVLGYSKLIDLFKKQKLIYMLCTVYGLAFLLLGYFIYFPDLLSVSQSSAMYPFVSWIPGRALGWFAYVLLESYGSMIIALFYSFVASVMTTGSAKKGYGIMFFVIQIGTVSGVLFSTFSVKSIGIAPLYLIGGSIILLVPFIVKLYLKTFPGDSEKDEKGGSKKKTGFFEGLRIILTRPYVVGIFVVATFYEIISTIVEYQMGWIASGVYTGREFTMFKGIQGLGINLLALFFAIIGTSFFMRKFGLKFCLIAFPTMIGAVVLTDFFCGYVLGVSNHYMMWILLASSVAIKGFNYALNKPTSEVMYIPTSKDVKFKSKGWIDVFGNRSTKGAGSTISKSLGFSFPVLLMYGTIISLGIIGVWIIIAAFVGNRFNKLQQTGEIVK